MVRASTFDYVAYGSSDTYELAFRIIRFPLSESACECIITNLPRDEFPPERIKKLYYTRFSIQPRRKTNMMRCLYCKENYSLSGMIANTQGFKQSISGNHDISYIGLHKHQYHYNSLRGRCTICLFLVP